MADPPLRSDLLSRLRAATPARVGLGRVGNALPTRPMLDFQLAHARARDAVHAGILSGDFTAIGGRPVIELRSRAPDRATYLARPDLGRQLDAHDLDRLSAHRGNIAIVIADGLSATAVRTHGLALATAILERLSDWSVAPVVIAHQGRVAIGDDIGAALGAQIVIVLIGERPGLSAADSVGAYITWSPRAGRMDSERNCVSNIRPPQGLSIADAADAIIAIINAARIHGITGVLLKGAETRLFNPHA